MALAGVRELSQPKQRTNHDCIPQCDIIGRMQGKATSVFRSAGSFQDHCSFLLLTSSYHLGMVY